MAETVIRFSRDEWEAARATATAVLAALSTQPAAAVTSDTSDGYHTFAELYEYRMLYNAHAAQGWLANGIPVVKSWRHSDGELAFGGGWFVVVAQLSTGQVTNHYKGAHWGLFDVPEVEKAPTWDGHTPAIAAERLGAALLSTQPTAVGCEGTCDYYGGVCVTCGRTEPTELAELFPGTLAALDRPGIRPEVQS